MEPIVYFFGEQYGILHSTTIFSGVFPYLQGDLTCVRGACYVVFMWQLSAQDNNPLSSAWS